ncbi:NUDIX domain-containing protein [Thermogemmatispora onikobensis]|uniref:NUDIX domain-containing protein n=1 Tax=Thermogemmatispora onikobensis TaxID=732234 RepID=UPI0008531230|nr:NUDIX domain-containing protein [Thermogemmatispora onikobensis]
MVESVYRYCPFCATPLREQMVGAVVRPSCPACDFVLYLGPKVVTVVVIEHEGQLLLGRRAIEPGRGKWSFCSGYVDRGEELEEAALREVKEETNLSVELLNLLGLYSRKGSPHLLVAYRARPLAGSLEELAPQPSEVSELAFFHPGAVPELAFPFDSVILRDWQALINRTRLSGSQSL